MPDDPGTLLGAVVLFAAAASAVGVWIRARRNPGVYEAQFDGYRSTVRLVAIRTASLVVVAAVLFAAFGPSRATVGADADSFSIELAGIGVAVGIALVVASVATGRVSDRLGRDATSTAWTTLRPSTPGEWAVYLPVSWIASTVEATLYVGFVVGGLTTGVTPTAFAVAGVTALVTASQSSWEGPGVVARNAAVFLILGAGFVLTRSLLVLTVAMGVNSLAVGLRRPSPDARGSATTGD